MEVCKKKIIPYSPLILRPPPPPPYLGIFSFCFFFLLFSIIFAFKIFVAFEAKYSGFGVPVNEFSGRANAENKKICPDKACHPTPPSESNGLPLLWVFFMTFVRVFYHQYYRKYSQKFTSSRLYILVGVIKSQCKAFVKKEPSTDSQEEPRPVGRRGGGRVALYFTLGVMLNDSRERCSAK